ncbi:transporter [Spirochaetia bacterium]|nr:transporter [Spirochaetia bacterium]
MQEFLDTVFWDNTARQWILAAAFIAGGAVAGKISTLIMTAVKKHLCEKTKNQLDDMVVTTLIRPLAIIVFLGGLALGLAVLHHNETVELWARRIISALFITDLAWGLGRIIDAIISQYIPAKVTDPAAKKQAALQPILRNVFKTVIWVIAAALILKSFGYNVSALMAGLGLGGAAIALASKDTLANFFGSITVFVDHPFRINDRIKILGYEGTIIDMSIRTSRLRTPDNHTVIIPNSVFAANPIENVSAEPYTRVSQNISIKRENGSEKIAQSLVLIKEVCSGVEGTAGTPAAGAATINGTVCQITYVYFVAKHADYLQTVSRVNIEILKRLEDAGILLG